MEHRYCRCFSLSMEQYSWSMSRAYHGNVAILSRIGSGGSFSCMKMFQYYHPGKSRGANAFLSRLSGKFLKRVFVKAYRKSFLCMRFDEPHVLNGGKLVRKLLTGMSIPESSFFLNGLKGWYVVLFFFSCHEYLIVLLFTTIVI